MAATSTNIGNPIYYIDGGWKYEDGVKLKEEERPCIRCSKLPTKEGYDACLGHISGAVSACCGHGVSKPILILEKYK